MVSIKTVLKIFLTIAKSVTLIILMFLVSLLIITFQISKENVANPYCVCDKDSSEVVLNYQEIANYAYKIECNTLYFKFHIDKQMEQDEIISLLLSVGESVSNRANFIHFELSGPYFEKTFYASYDVNDKKVSFIHSSNL